MSGAAQARSAACRRLFVVMSPGTTVTWMPKRSRSSAAVASSARARAR